MPCVVYLADSKEILIVKSAWCQNIDTADNRNGGLRPGEEMIIFVSPNKTDTADFELEPKLVYDASIAACYYGFVLQHCGK